jgi:hypothetical protein
MVLKKRKREREKTISNDDNEGMENAVRNETA